MKYLIDNEYHASRTPCSRPQSPDFANTYSVYASSNLLPEGRNQRQSWKFIYYPVDVKNIMFPSESKINMNDEYYYFIIGYLK